MQSKNAITIVHVMPGMCGIHKLYVIIWNTDVGHALKYSTLLPVLTRRPFGSSVKYTVHSYLPFAPTQRLSNDIKDRVRGEATA